MADNTTMTNGTGACPRHDENPFMDFWIDGILKLCLGCFGIFMNSLAISILVTQKKMQSMFLHILTCSLICDNGYMLMEMLTTLFYEFKVNDLVWIIPHFAFPFKEIFYTSNILITLALSYERYALISDSKGYRTTMTIAKFRYERLRKYILMIAFFSIAFNFPAFFTHSISSVTPNNCTSFKWKVSKTDLRRDATYKLLDKLVKWSIFLVVSFALLIFFNWKLFLQVKEKLEMRNRLVSTNGEENANENNENVGKFRQIWEMLKKLRKQEKFTVALFALVTSFFFCNIWFLLEVIFKGTGIKERNYEIISRLMRMLNACTNVFIYCIVDRSFKRYLKNYLKRIPYLMTCTLVEAVKPQDVTESCTESQPGPSSKRRTISLKAIQQKAESNT